MSGSQMMVRVRFRSRLSYDEVMAIVEARAPEFAALHGLEQKYYLHDVATGEFAGVYLWRDKASLDDYLRSQLRASIAAAYHVDGEPQVEVYRVVKLLR